ncbi:hypothetical protein [Paracoccus angustae]|uniref:hypothetical protein n=1 Tax=Paracoccus angustae TaxID=1671480 RepID=UPI00366B04AB
MAAVLGALRGIARARKLGGNRLDMIQYACGHAIAFGLLAALAGTVLARFLSS